MADKLQPVRGTHDLLPESCGGNFERFHEMIAFARDIATLYSFREMATPLFEATEVFKRSMGDTSDVVSKEMFDFATKGGEDVCLRPEFTAGIVRAFISNGMQQHLPLKLFSTGPLFRYERPQKGRQRQFHQVNFEWLGDASPEADVEIIMLAGHLLYILSGNDKKACTLYINTLGDMESRTKYRDALVAYLRPYAKDLSEDSQRRLTTNPLRILDSKSPEDRKIIEGAPQITHYLSDHSRKRFSIICEALSHQQIPFAQNFKITPSLVRGLDYYTDTVFEFVAETEDLGAQNTVLAGGRYDGLVEQMGGKPTPAIGFAAGVERLLLLAQNTTLPVPQHIKMHVLPLEGIEAAHTLAIATTLRFNINTILLRLASKNQCSLEIQWQGKLGKRMEKAAKMGAHYVVILGGDEYKQGQCVLKNMNTGNQQNVALADLHDYDKLSKLLAI